MKCATCQHRTEIVKGRLVDYLCEFTGAQVGPFQFRSGGHDGTKPVLHDDDPHLPCALTLEMVLCLPDGDEMVAGVLRGVAAKGKLERLLEAYRGRMRQRLERLAYGA
jgi:hypothetical protein